MSTVAIRLKFRDGLHIGRGSEDLDKTAAHYHSDALKSAVFSVGLPIFPHWSADNAKNYFENIRISSAFPWADSDLFVPKPSAMRFRFENSNELTETKKAKKISYVAMDVLRNWARNPEVQIVISDAAVGDGAFIFANGKGRKFIYTNVQQRVAVPHEEEDDQTRPFYFERLFFKESSGLYFLFNCSNATLYKEFMTALQWLGDSGIGTDRTVGNGQFDLFDATPIEVDLPSGNLGVQMPLGLYLPTRDEIARINLDNSSWGLVKRGGFIAGAMLPHHASLRKNSIYFFTEGSVFQTTHPLRGRFENLRPDWNDDTLHPVWRCGMPIFLHL